MLNMLFKIFLLTLFINNYNLRSNENELFNAEEYFKNGDIENAIRLLDGLENNLESKIRLASIYCYLENWKSLEEILISFKEYQNFHDLYYYYSARIALSQNKVGTARLLFEKALRNSNTETQGLIPYIYFYKSLCFLKLGMKKNLEEYLKLTIKHDFKPETKQEIKYLNKMRIYLDR